MTNRAAPAQSTFDDAGSVDIAARSVSEQDNMAYLLVDRATGEALLIDAADRAEQLQEMLAETAERAERRGDPRPRIVRILTTHKHWDHYRALAETAARTGAETLAGAADADELPVCPDRRLEHGDTVELGATTLRVIALRGHTPGSVALALVPPEGPPRLFTGDSLFPGGVGNTGGDAERFAGLLRDVEERVFACYPDETIVYPGHGAPTTLGAERPQLPEWRARGW